MEDAQRVLSDLTTVEREVRLDEDGWFLSRIAPYRTADDHIAGVVVTFVDITERRHAEEKLRAHAQELERFNRLAVGRETRMIDLKKEINDLLGRLNEQPRYELDFEEESSESSDG
jgi:hypothetical protein